MPLSIRLADLSTPQSWILKDSSPFNDGIMTALQAAQLAALVAGGGAPEAWVTWASLGFSDGFADSTPPFGPAQSRVNGDMVQLAGIVIAPPGGTAGNYHATTLPLAQRPASVRIMTGSYQVGAGARTVINVSIDDAAGSGTGVPGAVVIGATTDEIPAGGALISLDGLSFLLT